MAGSKPKAIEWIREGECIVVTSLKPKLDGYFRISRGGRGQVRESPLHRLVCERRHGSIGGLMATHSCDNRRCINPDHLIPGTGKDNMRGAVERGRIARGERASCVILTELQAREVFSMPGKLKAIAKRFGIHRCTVSDIKHKRTWKHIHNHA